MADRVVATEAALRAAQRAQSLLGGGLEQQVRSLSEALRTLSNPRVWDGPKAAEFRATQAPRHQAALVGAMESMRQLGTHAEHVTGSIMDAGTQGSGPAAGIAPQVATAPLGAAGASRGIDPKTIPTGDDPARNAAWWSSHRDWWHGLSREQQRIDYFKQHPDVAQQVGRLDGIPTDVRDAANREVLATVHAQMDQQQAQLKQQRSDLQQQLGDLQQTYQSERMIGSPDANATLRKIQDTQAHLGDINSQIAGNDAKLHGIGKLEERLRQQPKPPDDRAAYLLGVDTRGNGHYALSIGNPDTARNVVTFVPGVETRLEKADWGTGYSQNLFNQANGGSDKNVGPDKKVSTAVVYWAGYDAPQDVGSALGNHTTAENAAIPLDRFQQGLLDAHQATTRPHMVVIGHSYGSTVVGHAAQAPGGLRADDVIFIGSPGVDAPDAASLHVGRVWAGNDRYDPIGGNPFTGLGDLPNEYGFGATLFNADDGSSPLGVFNGNAHGDYLKPKTTSIKNIANIVTGNYGAVETLPPPTFFPPVPGGP